MKTLYIKAIILAGVLLGAVSCEKEIKFIGDYDGEKIVLYSSATAGTPLTAKLYKSRFILSTEEIHPFRDGFGLSGATVTVEVGGRTYPFTEDKSNSRTKGLYVSEYVPQVGDHIVIKAECQGLRSVTSETMVPAPAKASFKSSYYKEGSVTEDGYINFPEQHFVIELDDPADAHNIYMIRLIRDYEGEYYEYNPETEEYEMYYGQIIQPQWLRSSDVLFLNKSNNILDLDFGMEGVATVPQFVDDGSFNGTKRTFDVFKPMNTYIDGVGENEAPDLSEYYFEIVSVNEDFYKYRRSVDDYDDTLGGFNGVFGEAVSIVNNIQGGIGCFGALTVMKLNVE